MRCLGVVLMLAGCGRFGFTNDPNAAIDSNAMPVDAAPLPNRAFVTSADYPATFGGIAFASGACQQAADAAHLGGTFTALLGDSTQQAAAVVANARGWVDLAGEQLVDQPSEWLDGSMRRPLLRDEHGAIVGYAVIWLGARATDTCSDWMATTGNGGIATTTNYLTEFDITSCTSRGHFACVETARSVPLPEPSVAGKLVFVTTATWTPAGGLPGADLACMDDATAHGFGGTFVAALNASTTSRFARIANPLATFINRRGIAIVLPGSDITSISYLDAFLVRSDGMPAPGEPGRWAWSGHMTDGNCTDWSSGVGQGVVGDESSVYAAHIAERFSYACTDSRPLICFEN